MMRRSGFNLTIGLIGVVVTEQLGIRAVIVGGNHDGFFSWTVVYVFVISLLVAGLSLVMKVTSG